MAVLRFNSFLKFNHVFFKDQNLNRNKNITCYVEVIWELKEQNLSLQMSISLICWSWLAPPLALVTWGTWSSSGWWAWVSPTSEWSGVQLLWESGFSEHMDPELFPTQWSQSQHVVGFCLFFRFFFFFFKEEKKDYEYDLVFVFVVLGIKPRACWARALPLTYTPGPYSQFSPWEHLPLSLTTKTLL